MSYLVLKQIHVTCVALSLCGFTLRAGWMLADSPMLERRWVKIAPHLVDSLLLASAIGLTLVIHQYPFEQPWLTAKLVGLLAYIGLGMMALRRGRTKLIRALSAAGALVVFGYIVSVAVTKNPIGIFALI